MREDGHHSDAERRWGAGADDDAGQEVGAGQPPRGNRGQRIRQAKNAFNCRAMPFSCMSVAIRTVSS